MNCNQRHQMKQKTEADIDREIKQLEERKKEITKAKKIAYADGIAKAIKTGKLDGKSINDALNNVVKSKKDRALLGLTGTAPIPPIR